MTRSEACNNFDRAILNRGKGVEDHLISRVPDVEDSAVPDETGCGDQVTAVVASCLAEGRDLIEAAGLAVRAGTLQFYKAGIQPITRKELE